MRLSMIPPQSFPKVWSERIKCITHVTIQIYRNSGACAEHARCEHRRLLKEHLLLPVKSCVWLRARKCLAEQLVGREASVWSGSDFGAFFPCRPGPAASRYDNSLTLHKFRKMIIHLTSFELLCVLCCFITRVLRFACVLSRVFHTLLVLSRVFLCDEIKSCVVCWVLLDRLWQQSLTFLFSPGRSLPPIVLADPLSPPPSKRGRPSLYVGGEQLN